MTMNEYDLCNHLGAEEMLQLETEWKTGRDQNDNSPLPKEPCVSTYAAEYGRVYETNTKSQVEEKA